MENQRKAIAERLRGLRDASDYSIDGVARLTGIAEDALARYEDGSLDVPMSVISVLAALYKVEPTAILTGGDAHAKVVRVTRKETGAVVERRNVYHYEALSVMFAGKKMEPFVVTVEPSLSDLHLNSHPGQEFNYLLSGRLRLVVDGKESVLEPGDSIYFDASKPHGMQALGDEPARFLAVITA